MTLLIAQGFSYHSTTLKFTKLLRVSHSFTVSVEVVRMLRWLVSVPAAMNMIETLKINYLDG